MKNTVKILALLLVLLMIVPMIVSCKDKDKGAGAENDATESTDAGTDGTTAGTDGTGTGNGGDDSDSTSASDTTDTEQQTNTWGDVVIESGINETYDGANVNILYRGNTEQYAREWTSDTEKPDTLQTAIFKRNADLQQKLNVVINFISNTKNDGPGMNELLLAEFKSGSGSYHIVSQYAAYTGTMQNISGFMNLNNDQLYNMHLEKGYWNQSFINEATAYGKLFVAVGDVNRSVYDRCHVVFFNKAEASERLGNFDELYQMVLSGDWTYDMFYEMVSEIHEDNGTAEEEDDFYGVASIHNSEAFDGFLYAFGGKLTQDDGTGKRVLVTDSNFTKTNNVFDKVSEFWAADGAKTFGSSQANFDFFCGGQALFDIDVVYHYASGLQQMKDMEDGFGVLPMPKLDTDQEDYYTGVQDAHNSMAVLWHNRFDYGMISAVLETFCELSYNNVRPLYIEKIVKGQTLDKNSAEVFDICISGARWDFADIYANATGNVRNNIWRGPLNTLRQTPGSTSFKTAYDGKAVSLTEKLNEMDDFLATVD